MPGHGHLEMCLLLQYLGNTQLNAGEETSVEYGIFFPRQLPPREFILKMQVSRLCQCTRCM